VRYGLRDIPEILASPGRSLVIEGALITYSWPVMSRLARLHRRTLIRRTRLATVVGTYGKTTTTRAVGAALGLPPEASINRTHGSLLALGLLAIPPTQARAVLEVAIDRAGQMATFASLTRPDIVVVTSIGSEHGRYLGGPEAVRQEKAAMVRTLGPDGVVFLNGDDPHVRWMMGQTRAKAVTFGLGQDNDVWADNIALDWPAGMRFTLHAAGRSLAAQTRLLGRHQLRAVLAAVAVALAERVDLDAALARLARLPPTPSRLEPVVLPNGAILLRDEFKSPIETIDAALDLLAEIPARRKIVVLGEVAETPAGMRSIYRRIGERLAGIAARVIVVGTNHRLYAAGARRAGMPADAVVDAGSRPSHALARLREDLGVGDVVLIKGRTGQRLQRIALALEGRTVGCDLATCRVYAGIGCERCPVLESGWQDRRVLP
jgi:UDP-N-acetylmuramoyl-tripeptide--D-alanyl-D-alanine ligase